MYKGIPHFELICVFLAVAGSKYCTFAFNISHPTQFELKGFIFAVHELKVWYSLKLDQKGNFFKWLFSTNV